MSDVLDRYNEFVEAAQRLFDELYTWEHGEERYDDPTQPGALTTVVAPQSTRAWARAGRQIARCRAILDDLDAQIAAATRREEP